MSLLVDMTMLCTASQLRCSTAFAEQQQRCMYADGGCIINM